MDAIVAEDVHKSYGDVTALDGVSIRVPQGQILGLLGPNGAGKTTLVRCLTTLLEPDRGTLTIGGFDLGREKGKVRQIIGLSGQYSAVDEQLTGRENLVMVGRLYHMSRSDAQKQATKLLEQFSLTDAADRPVKTYSGGMRRRLDLAASVIVAPPVLFLDEPTTGLDPSARKELWNFIKKLATEGTTLLLTTQYLEEADFLADNIVLITRGSVAAEGTADELKASLASDVIEVRPEREHDRERAMKLMAELGKDEPQLDEATGLISMMVEEGSKSLMQVVRVLDQNKIEIADISLRRPSLDDVFLSMTAEEEESKKND